jgi:hypothetical protein
MANVRNRNSSGSGSKPAGKPKDRPASTHPASTHPASTHDEHDVWEVGRSTTRRDSVVDRRSGIDRRLTSAESSGGAESTNLERRRGPGRRRTDFMRSAEEGEMTKEQFLFVMAIDAFKKVNDKTFPTWTDVLEVIRKLGYRKTMPSELNLGQRAVDWVERPDSPSNVFKASAEDDDDSSEDADSLAA